MKNPNFNKLLKEIGELHDKKNSDYASDSNPYSNFEFAASIVEQFSNPVDQVFAGRIGDKLARLGQLLGEGKEPKNESIDDTMVDLVILMGLWTARRRSYEPALGYEATEALKEVFKNSKIKSTSQKNPSTEENPQT